MLDLFSFSYLLFLLHFSPGSLHFLSFEFICSIASKHSSSQPLNKECCFIPSFFPHFRVEIELGFDHPIIPRINKQTSNLHLRPIFP